MGQPHKHAALIKAWADGADIQVEDSGGRWVDCGCHQPLWSVGLKYRIKLKTIKYRLFLWTPYMDSSTKMVSVCNYEENKDSPRENWNGFVKWVGPWQEIAIEENN